VEQARGIEGLARLSSYAYFEGVTTLKSDNRRFLDPYTLQPIAEMDSCNPVSIYQITSTLIHLESGQHTNTKAYGYSLIDTDISSSSPSSSRRRKDGEVPIQIVQCLPRCLGKDVQQR
jgi:hypothetical protein